MTKFTRSKLAVAMAVALATGLGVSSQAYAAAYNAGTDAWDVEDTGDVLLFPYYTVTNVIDKDGNAGEPFNTSFTITNTDTVNTVVVKFRLRDHVNSQDVLDFQLIMSPSDEVVATLTQSASGKPQVTFPDDEKTCRVPWNNGSSVIEAPNGGPSVADSQEGHLEVLGMYILPTNGVITAANVLDGDRAVHAMPNHEQNCSSLSDALGGKSGTVSAAMVEAAVLAAQPVPALPALPGDGSILAGMNPLRGAWAITSKDHGFSGGGKAIAIRDWGIGADPSTMQVPQNSNGAGIPSNQLDKADTEAYAHPHLGDSSIVLPALTSPTMNLEAESGLGLPTIMNNWSVNSANGVGIDWVVTYFTKYLWRDVNGFYGPAGAYVWPAVAYASSGYDPTAGGTITSPWTTAKGTASATNGGACIRIPNASAMVFDREEQSVGGGVSPGNTPIALCDESSVISFGQNGDRRVVLKSDAIVIDATGLDLPYGWADINVNPGAVAGTAGTVAVGGFSYTLKDLGDSTISYGSVTPHSVH